MKHNVTIFTEEGKPDSLNRRVKIAFTLTPPSSNPSDFEPIAFAVGTFPKNAETTVQFGWNTKLAFSTHNIKTTKSGRRDCIVFPGNPMLAGQVRSMTRSRVNQEVVWSDPSPSPGMTGPPSIVAHNRTGGEQNLALLVQDPSDSSYRASAAYRSVNGGWTFVPHGLELQAYVVGEVVREGMILTEEDLQSPVFATPINYDALPVSFKWRLHQGNNGEVRLAREGRPEQKQSIVALVKSQEEMKSQLAAVLASLSSTQDRLLLMEDSITRTQNDVLSGQQDMADLRRQLLEGTGSTNRLFTVESKANKLTESLSQSQERMSVMQKAVAGVQRVLTTVEEAVNATQGQLIDLNHRVPSIESVTKELRTSFDRSQDRLSMLEVSASRSRDDISTVQQLVVATQLSLVSQSANNPPGTPQLTVEAPRSSDPLNTKANAEVEASLDEARKDIFAIRKYLGVMDRRVPAVEEKAENLKGLLGQTQGELSGLRKSLEITGDQIAGLDSRVTAIEKAGPLHESPIIFPGEPGREEGNPIRPSSPDASPLGEDYSARLFRDTL